MAQPRSREPESFPGLLRELTSEVTGLFRKELELARTETFEKVSRATSNLAMVVIGAAIGLAALLVLATAITRGLTALLAQVVTLEIAVWLAPLVLAIVLGLIAYVMIARGMRAIKRTSLVPEKTAEMLREDREWLREKI